MSCSACSAAVGRAVSGVAGVSEANADLISSTLFVSCPESVADSDITDAVKAAGFGVLRINAAAGSAKTAAAPAGEGFTPARTRLIVSAVFLLPLLYISMGHMLGLPLPSFLCGGENALSFAFIQFLLTLPVLYINRKFFISGFRAFARRSPNMDSLISVGSGASVIYGIVMIFMIGSALGQGDTAAASSYSMNLYFESSAMILTLVTLGKLLEERSRRRAGDAVAGLLRLSPKTALVIRGGKETEIPAEELAAGDIIIIKPGDSIPADGKVTEGTSLVDESALTGESVPAEKAPGSSVMTASKNISGVLHVRAERVGEDTTLSKIIGLVENASGSRAPIAKLADRISGVFVPSVILLSLITAAVWLIFTGSVFRAFSFAVDVLVISCPCALGLATPMAVAVSVGRCAKKGILIKSGDAIERLARTDTVILDKTGTVTVGHPAITDIIVLRGERETLLCEAAALEAGGTHPLARAICEEAKGLGLPKVSGFSSKSGLGISGVLDGGTGIDIGSAAYMRELGVDISGLEGDGERLAGEGKTVVYAAKGGKAAGMFAAADKLKESSAQAVSELYALGLSVMMLSGDNRGSAQAAAAEAGIKQVFSGLLPADKAEMVGSLSSLGKKTVMVGDGINDSPALARADVGISVRSGADIAVDCSDVILMNDDLRGVPDVIGFCRAAVKNIRINLFWAFAYNTLSIPLAAGVLFPAFGIALSPAVAAAAMSLSSLFVVGNSLRLLRK